MITPEFTFNDEANAWLSEPIEIDTTIRVHLELVSVAPVVIMKREDDGGWANYGQSPKDARCYGITLKPTEAAVVMLAVPVAVRECYIL